MSEILLDNAYRNKYVPIVSRVKKISVVFFKTDRGNEPVWEWLMNKVSLENRKIIGADIATVEYGWPIGMPVCGTLGGGLYEVRSNLDNKTISRVLFTIIGNKMILLHGFIKKDQETPERDKKLARGRMQKYDCK